MATSDVLPLAVTQGDPAGIGPEIALKAWLRRDEAGLPPFCLIGDPDHLSGLARGLGLAVPVLRAEPGEVVGLFRTGLPVLPLPLAAPAVPGHPDPANAAPTIAAIDRAVALVGAGDCAAVVTAPIAKYVLYAAGFRHPGHTEYLAELAKGSDGTAPRPVMMLWSEDLAVVPVTIHVPLAAVPGLLTTSLIADTARIVAGDLARRFGIARPRLAVAGLNPHAGEAGTIGTEDRDVVGPAVAALAAEGLAIVGPHPADTLFHAEARRGYDAVLAMYHDQALIPIKTLAFDKAVNVTLGLPFVRTSPDHGTAFDIAGRGIARPDSLIEAIRLAGRLAGASVPAAA